MDIGQAIYAMQNGYKVMRTGWKISDQYLEIHKPDEGSKDEETYIVISIGGSDFILWSAPQDDLLAHDWIHLGTLGYMNEL